MRYNPYTEITEDDEQNKDFQTPVDIGLHQGAALAWLKNRENARAPAGDETKTIPMGDDSGKGGGGDKSLFDRVSEVYRNKDLGNSPSAPKASSPFTNSLGDVQGNPGGFEDKAAKDSLDKLDNENMSNKDMLLLSLLGTLPSLIGYTVHGNIGGAMAGQQGGVEGVKAYISGRNKQKDREALSARLYQDAKTRSDTLDIQKQSLLDSKKYHDAMIDINNRKIDAKAQGSGSSGSIIKSVDALHKDANISKELTKLNAARGVQALFEKIDSGELVGSKNISKQLTNMITTIEMGGPGADADRKASGVDTLYGALKGYSGYLNGEPTDVLPDKYKNQLSGEADALGDRAAANYKNLTDLKLKMSDNSLGDDTKDKGEIYKRLKMARDHFLNSNGYNPETVERIKKEKPRTRTAPKTVSPFQLPASSDIPTDQDIENMTDEERDHYSQTGTRLKR